MKSLGATEEQVLANIRESTHWPMEGFISPAALAHVETAIRFYLAHRMERDGMAERPDMRGELTLLANNIRSHLQHVVADAREYEVDQRIARAWAARKAATVEECAECQNAPCVCDAVTEQYNARKAATEPTDEELLAWAAALKRAREADGPTDEELLA